MGRQKLDTQVKTSENLMQISTCELVTNTVSKY